MKLRNYRKILILAFLIGYCPIILESCKPVNEKKTEVMENQDTLKTIPEWTKDKNIYEVNVRQFTPEGTFKAFEAHLPRLKAMGVDIVWFMPVNPIGKLNRKGTKGSHYSVADYKSINPEYGTLEEFKALVKKMHDMDMYVLIDWVANHSAWDNVWTKDHPDFYTKDSSGNFVPPVPDWSDVIDLDYSNIQMQDSMIDALKFWVKEADIDGYRCDVADMVPTEFWNRARKELDKIKPVFMLAEAEIEELHKEAFDMSYTWKLMHTMNDIAKGEKKPAEIDSIMQWEKTEFTPEDYRMRFITNHDENSWNGTEFERLGDGVKTYAVLINTIPGMPLMYNGQESGLNRRLAFFDKDSIEWGNYSYADFFTKLNKLKKQNKALFNGIHGGSYSYIPFPNENVFCFKREKEDNVLFVLLNLTKGEQYIPEQKEINGTFHDFFSEEEVEIDSVTEITLEPWEYVVLIKK